MKTRFTPLITIKKEMMERCERELGRANRDLEDAKRALQEAYDQLQSASLPRHGNAALLKGAHAVQSSQRTIIAETRERVAFCERQSEAAKRKLQAAVIEFEKFKYLEAEEVKKAEKERRRKEQAALDEVAVQTYNRKGESA